MREMGSTLIILLYKKIVGHNRLFLGGDGAKRSDKQSDSFYDYLIFYVIGIVPEGAKL